MASDEPNDDFDYYKFELENNKYTKFYSEQLEDKDRFKRETDTDIQRELRKYTHRDAIEFAAKTWDWEKNTNEPLKRQAEATPTYKCQEGIRAYYRVLITKEDKYILIACHVNVHGYHRGDLRFVEVNDRTVLRGLKKVSVIGKLYPGDVVAVTKMGKKSKVDSTPPTVFNVHRDTDCTWEVQNMTLLTRRKENRDVTFAILENGLAVVQGHGEAMEVIKDQKNLPLKIDTMYSGSAFIPEKIEVDFTEDFHRKYKNPLTALTSRIPSYANSFGTIYSYEFCVTKTRLFEIGTKAFDSETFLSHSKESDEIVETCVTMGASAAEAVSNRRFDSRGFPMKDIKQEGAILHFSIANPSNKPTENRWNANNRIRLDGGKGTINAIIETVVLGSNRKTIRIAARLPKSYPKGVSFCGVWIVHQQKMSERMRLESGFLKGVPLNSNGRRVIETLYGGPSMTLNNNQMNSEAEFYFPSESPVDLNEYQNLYVSMILADLPLVLGNSPFGCGKSMTIVTAAIEVHKRNSRFNNHGKHRQQLLITQTNNAGVSLIDIARKVVDVKVKFLRYVSESNWEVLPEYSRTVLDMPVLMKELFVKWATGALDDNQEKQSLQREMKHAIVRKLVRQKVKPEQFVGEAKRIFTNLSNQDKKIAPSPRILRSAFFILYQPDIIVTTADSLNSLLLGEVLKYISNLQIDEASQLPEHTLIYLLQMFPHAGFGLVGDIKQLPPHCEKELVGHLKDYGVGNTMERALNNKMFPQSVLLHVYRCHPVITTLLSDLFYQSRLISEVEEKDRNEFMRMRSDIWPNEKFPILVLNHETPGHRMGTSVVNESELLHVLRIVKSLTRKVNGYKLSNSDIGIISFYRAQTSLLTEAFRGTNVKCGTVDAFQGTEREVMIVCSTNDKPSDFMKCPNRFNVAMSRARQATIVIGNVRKLREALYWDTIVKKASKNGCLFDEIENFGDEDFPGIDATRYYRISNDRGDSSDSDDSCSDDKSLLIVKEEDNDSDSKKSTRKRRSGRRRGGKNRREGANNQRQSNQQRGLAAEIENNMNLRKLHSNQSQRKAQCRQNNSYSSVVVGRKAQSEEVVPAPIIEKNHVPPNDHDKSDDEVLMKGRRRQMNNEQKRNGDTQSTDAAANQRTKNRRDRRQRAQQRQLEEQSGERDQAPEAGGDMNRQKSQPNKRQRKARRRQNSTYSLVIVEEETPKEQVAAQKNGNKQVIPAPVIEQNTVPPNDNDKSYSKVLTGRRGLMNNLPVF